jgi:uncharacterized protein
MARERPAGPQVLHCLGAAVSACGPNGRRRKPHREHLAPGEVLCQFCPAKCCRYFALPIETPTEWSDFEYMRWYLLHHRAAVFTEDGSWYLLVYNPCKHLGEDNRCAIYDDRPPICRQYKTVDCEYEDEWVYDQYFEVPEQVEEYAEAVLGKPRKGRGMRSPRPVMEPPMNKPTVSRTGVSPVDGESARPDRRDAGPTVADDRRDAGPTVADARFDDP